jgi:phosphate transport system substrate-binding protein
MRLRLRRAAWAALLLALPGTAPAQDVTLTSRDGTLSIPGMFQSYDGEVFRVMTDYGPLTLDSQGVVCEGPGCPDLTGFVARIRVVGEGDAGTRILAPLLAAFAADRGYVLAQDGVALLLRDGQDTRTVARFEVEARRPQDAVQAVASGRADFALSGLDAPDLVARPLGMMPLVAVVAPDNPLRSLSTADLARALSGQVTNWQDLGGPDMPLVVHALRPETDLRQAQETRLEVKMLPGEAHETAQALSAAVARDPWALAVTVGPVAGARVLPLTDECGLALSPDPMATKAGDYPLALPYFVLLPKRRLPLLAREFLDFARSPAAQNAVAEAGLVDGTLVRGDLLGDGLRLANAIGAVGPDVPVEELRRLTAAMAGADRLSLSLRFEGDALDAASQARLNDLVRLIEAGQFTDMDLIFAGFTDSRGDGAANLALSKARADGVLDAVASAVPDLGDMRVSLRSAGFGEALPVACDDNALGRRLNARVEVWLRPTQRGLTDSAGP